MYCGECKKECEGDWIDVGIGSYEFWGARGCDTRMVYVSKCCEGDVFEDKECTKEFEPEPDDDCYADDESGWT